MLSTKIIKLLKRLAKKLETSLKAKAKRQLEVCAERTDIEFEIAAKRLELANEIYEKMEARAGDKLAKGLNKLNEDKKVAAAKIKQIEDELKE